MSATAGTAGSAPLPVASHPASRWRRFRRRPSSARLRRAGENADRVLGGTPMTTRRNFLKGGTAAATGIVSCSCGLLARAHAQAGMRTLPIAVNGKKVKTIDIHAHCHFREAGALLGAEAASLQLPPVRDAQEAFIEIDKRLKAMDGQAIDMEVLSINPFWYGRDRELAGQIVKIQNEKLAELCAAKPDRFAAFASLTLQAPDLAVQELETAVKKQGLKGAAIGGA